MTFKELRQAYEAKYGQAPAALAGVDHEGILSDAKGNVGKAVHYLRLEVLQKIVQDATNEVIDLVRRGPPE